MNATTALVFGLLALLLAGPVPALLSRSTWPYRAPRAALVLWQAVAIAAVLSAFSSGLAIASQLLVPGADGRPTTAPTAEIDALGLPLWILYVVVFCPDASDRREADLLDHPGRCENPTSPCTSPRVGGPSRRLRHARVGGTHTRSAGTGRRRTDRILPARSASTRGSQSRHSAEPRSCRGQSHPDARAFPPASSSRSGPRAFTAVNHAFPRFVRSKSALGSVQLLVELLADDSAVRATGPTPLARALVACAGSTAPRGAMAAGGPSTLIRVQRLSADDADPRIAVFAYLGAVAILVVPTVAVAVPWLTELRLLFNAY